MRVMLKNEIYVEKQSLCWKTKLMLENIVYYAEQSSSCRSVFIVKTWDHIGSGMCPKFHFEYNKINITTAVSVAHRQQRVRS